MFRRAKLAEKLARENKFKEPKVRKCKEIVTHAKERNDVERIFALASFPKKRQALYRTVVGLPQTELDQNIYMLADIVLRCLLEDSVIDKLFYTALGRLLRSARGAAIWGLCVDYLKAQLAVDSAYLTYAEFLVRNHSRVVAARRNELLLCITDPKLSKSIANMKAPSSVRTCSYTEPVVFTRAACGIS